MKESTKTPSVSQYDTVIIGAGFYGCALAAHLAAQGKSVLVCEMASASMERASAVNQARVHTGFHYPRSFATALRSRHNFERFADDFQEAVRRDFQMLYAIARFRTKVNAQRFEGMFRAMDAPIERASAGQRALFSEDLVEDVFACTEYAFDYVSLRKIVFSRLAPLPVELLFQAEVDSVKTLGDGIEVQLAGGVKVHTAEVFNITYSQINSVLKASGIAPLGLKHEMVEIALVEPPKALAGLAVTLMDGAFFSCMPYPSANLYSLTHVRYTPHFGWTDETSSEDAYSMAARLPCETRWRHMINDSCRFMPALGDAVWQRSLFDVKTVPVRNEHDDGRPILLKSHPEVPGFHSVLGSKIDNIYDLFEALG